MDYKISFAALPQNLEEMQALPEGKLNDPAGTAALTIAALCVYARDREECYRMLNHLRGPRPLSPYEKQFIRDRFMDGRDYIPRSYFQGATPDNGYTPSVPYTLIISDSYSEVSDPGYKKFDIRSGGADSPRQIMVRNKPSTGEWFLWEQYLLSQIRIPRSADPWA